MKNIDACFAMKNGTFIKINFTEESVRKVLDQFANFDPLAKNAGTQIIRVVNGDGALVSVIRCDEVAAITT